MKVLAFDAPARAHAEIAELGSFVGGISALHDLVELVGPLVGRITAEPCGLDHAAALRRRGLLVLAGKIVFADRAADLVEDSARLALRMQRLAALLSGFYKGRGALSPIRVSVEQDHAVYVEPNLWVQHQLG